MNNQDPIYRKKVYQALKGELGDSFTKTEDEFSNLLDTDKSYAKKVYTALKGELGDSFTKTENDFLSSIYSDTKPKKKETSASPSTSGGEVGTQGGKPKPPILSEELKQEYRIDENAKVKKPTYENYHYQGGNLIEGNETKEEQLHQQHKENNADYSELYNRYKNETSITEEDKQELTQGIDNDLQEKGIWNTLTQGAKRLWNKTQTHSKEQIVDENPLANERKQAITELQKDGAKELDEELILAKTKEIALQKRRQSLVESKQRSFMEDLSDEEKQSLENYQNFEMKSFSRNDKQLMAETSLLKKNLDVKASELKDLSEKVKQYRKGEVPKDLAIQYQNKLKEVNTLGSEAKEKFLQYAENRKELGTALDNLDLFKRDYGFFTNIGKNIEASTTDIISGLAGGVAYGLDTSDRLTGLSLNKPISEKALAISKFFKDDAEETRNSIMRPLSVDDINTMDDFGRWFFNTAIAQQVPILALTSTGVGGITALGVSGTGNKYTEMQEEGGYSDLQNIFVPIAFGGAEAFGSFVDATIIKGAGRILKSATDVERRMIAQGMFARAKEIGLDVGKSSLKEISEEAGTQVFQNMLDKYALSKDVVLADGVKDAIASSSVFALMPLFGHTGRFAKEYIKPFMHKDIQFDKTLKEISFLENELNSPENVLSDNIKSALERKLSKKKEVLVNKFSDVAKTVADMDDATYNEIIKVEKEKNAIREDAKAIQDDKGISDKVKELLLKDFKDDFKKVEDKQKELLNPTPKPNNVTNEIWQQKKDEATNLLVKEKQEQGEKDFTITDADIGKKATELLNVDKTESTETKPTIKPNPIFEKARKKIADLFEFAVSNKSEYDWEDIANVSKENAKKISEATGLEITEDYKHVIESNAIRHSLDKHGNQESESKRGQVAITKQDFELVPEIINNADVIKDGGKAKQTGQQTVIYEKTFNDGTTYIVEEIRTGRKKLAFKTMYKRKPTITGGLMPTSNSPSPITSETLPAPDKSASFNEDSDIQQRENADLKSPSTNVQKTTATSLSSNANIQNKTLSVEAQKEIEEKQQKIKAYEQELTNSNLPTTLREQTEQKLATLEQEIESLQNPINEKKQKDTVQEKEQEVLSSQDTEKEQSVKKLNTFDETQQVSNSNIKPIEIKEGKNIYLVSKENGVLIVKNKEGNSPSKPTERKILREYAKKYDFTVGEKYVIPNDITPNDDIDSEVARNSNNPSELAEVALRTKTKDFINDNLDTDAIEIIEYVQGNVKRGIRNSKGADGSFINQSDANNITNAIAKTYLKKDGKGLDVLAQELSEQMGREITEQDIVDIILAYPNGVNDVQKEVRDKYSNPAKQRFTEITGLPSSDWYLSEAVKQGIAKEQLNKTQEQDYLNHLSEEDLLSLEQEQIEFNNYEKTNEQRNEVVFRTSDTSQNEQRPRVQGKSDSVSRTEESRERTKPTKVYDSSTQRELRKGNETDRGMEELTNQLNRSNRTNEKKLSKQELIDNERFETLQFAKENGLWIDDFYSLGEPTNVGGHENTLVLDVKNNVVYKSNNLFNTNHLVSGLLEKVKLHNLIFPLTRYDIIGFEGMDNGNKRPPVTNPVLKQNLIKDAVQAQPNEIKAYMESLGFKQTTPESYVNKDYLVFDLYPRNVLKDKNGTIYVVDAEFKKIKKNKSNKSKNISNLAKIDSDGQDYKTTADRILKGKLDLKRLPQEAERGRIKGGRRNVEATLVVGTSNGTAKNLEAKQTELEKQQFQEKQLIAYAKRERIWFEENHDFGVFYDNGQEANVHLNKDGKTVTKVFNPYVFSLNPQEFLDRIAITNSLFPETALTLKGFTTENGEFRFVLEQPFIKKSNEILTPKEITDFLNSIGYKDNSSGTFTNDYYVLDDLHNGNIVKGIDGNIYAIDVVAWLNTEKEGYGGKQVYNELLPSDKSILKRGSESLQTLDDTLKKWEDKLDQFGKETLGMNMPVAVAQGMIKAMRLAVKTAKTTLDVLEAGRNYVRNTDWYKNLSETDKNNVEKILTDDRNVFNNMDKVIDDAVEKARKEEKNKSDKRAERLKETTKKLRKQYVDIQQYKNEVINEIRQRLKTDTLSYLTKTDVTSVLRQMNNAKTYKRVEALIDKVDFILSRGEYKKADADVKKLLKEPRKFLKSVNGQPKANRVDNETRKLFNRIFGYLSSNSNTLQTLLNQVDTKIANGDISDRTLNEKVAIESALQIQDATDLFEASKEVINKKNNAENAERLQLATELKQRAFNDLQTLLNEGKYKLREQIKQEAKRLKQISEDFTEATNHKWNNTATNTEKANAQHKKKNSIFSKIFDTPKKVKDFFTKTVTNSFEYLLGYFDQQSNHGEGKPYQHFYSGENGIVQCDANYKNDKKQIKSEVKEGLKKILGVKLETLYNLHKHEQKITKEKATGIHLLIDGKRETQQQTMSISQALYVHLVSKMPDAKRKLEAQGWDDVAILQLQKYLGEDFLKVSDFMTDFLRNKYDKYNGTYNELLRTDLGFEDGYFPLKYIDADLNMEVDLAGSKFALPSVSNGHLKSKVKNKNRIDTKTDAFQVFNGYLESMERFHHYGRFTKDLNAVLSNKVIRNNMKTFDEKSLKDFQKLSKAVIGDTSDIKANNTERKLYRFNGAIAAGYIGYKGYTALKQFLSIPAYTEKANDVHIGFNGNQIRVPLAGKLVFGSKMVINLNPFSVWKSYRFLKKNSAHFVDRLDKGSVGDEFIDNLFSQNSSSLYSKAFKYIAKKGITPNKFIDAITISTGGKVYYDQQFKNYKKAGLKESEAHIKAIRDFEISFKLTQQSSDASDLALIQHSKGVMTSLFVPFKNAQFSYLRRISANSNNILRRYKKEKHRLQELGVSDAKAGVKALKKVSLEGQTYRDLENVLLYTHALPLLWQYVGSGLPGLLTDWEEDDTEEMVRAGALGVFEGVFILGDATKWIYNSTVLGKNWNYETSILLSEMQTILNDIKRAYKNAGEFNEDVLLEAGKGYLKTKSVNTDTFINIYDGANQMIEEGEFSQQALMKILNAPKELRKGNSEDNSTNSIKNTGYKNIRYKQ